MRTFLASLLVVTFTSPLLGVTIPNGYYVMQGVHKTNVSDNVITSKNLTGFHLRDSWDLLEPQKGVYNYTYFDTQLARASRMGKTVTLGLYAGVGSDPSWGNSTVEFNKAVANLGARYGTSLLVDAVHISAPQVTNNSMEMYPPSSWHGSDAQAIAIWEQSIDAFSKAFPDKPLILDLAMAPDSRGAITKAVDEYARITLGSRLNVIICNLKATTSLTAPHVAELRRLHAEGVRIGAEMVGPSTDTSRFGGPFSKAISIGHGLEMSWYQIYQADVPKIPLLANGPIPEPASYVYFAIAMSILTLYSRLRRLV